MSASSKSRDRLMRDVKGVMGCSDLKNFGIALNITDNMREMSALIRGPENSPYQGASFQISLKIPTNYPYRPPIAKFITHVWHPNVDSSSGDICVDVLKDKWTPSLDLRSVLISIQNLLQNPDATSPQDHDVGIQMRQNTEAFIKTAKVWTKVYGIDCQAEGDEEYNNILAQLEEMGIWKPQALRFLSTHNWSLDAATAHFFPE